MNAAHFPAYAEELREFSASHGLPCGTPEDLRVLVATLDARGTFFEECSSMLRSVVYRERGEADAGSLLMLVAGVWGGLTEPEAETVCLLRQFVCGAMRAPQIGELEPEAHDVLPMTSSAERALDPRAAEAEAAGPVVQQVFSEAQQALSELEIESALRELEARSAEVRLYRELLDQREARWYEAVTLGAAPVAGMTVSEAGSEEAGAGQEAGESQTAFARGFDPWDESSDLQKELRRFARHRERVLAREAEKAMRPLPAKLLGGVGSALVQLLGKDHPLRRALGLRSH